MLSRGMSARNVTAIVEQVQHGVIGTSEPFREGMSI